LRGRGGETRDHAGLPGQGVRRVSGRPRPARQRDPAVPRAVGTADPERTGAVLRAGDGPGAGRVPDVRRVPGGEVASKVGDSLRESQSLAERVTYSQEQALA